MREQGETALGVGGRGGGGGGGKCSEPNIKGLGIIGSLSLCKADQSCEKKNSA